MSSRRTASHSGDPGFQSDAGVQSQRANGRRLVAAETVSRHAEQVEKKRWNELSSRTRRWIIIAGTFEGLLKAAALIDLARRPAQDVRGSKPRWAAAIVVINAFGAVPIVYFVFGRRRDS